MNKAQKCAWFNLTVTLVLVSLHAAAFILIFNIGYIPKTLNTIGFFVVFGLIGLFSLVFQRKQKFVEPEFDERDRFINRRVLVVDYFLLWSLLTAGCVLIWFLMGSEGVIKVYALCASFYGLFLTAAIVHSITTITLYGIGSKDG